MIQFKVYLKAEFGKLRDPGDAGKFLAAVPCDLLNRCGLKNNVDALTKQFSSQEKINEFVDKLDGDCLRHLTQFIDLKWRKNGVYNKVNESSEWFESEVETAIISLGYAEKELKHLWQSCGYELSRIATNLEVLATKQYSEREPGEHVDFPVCLATKHGLKCYRIFDGMHRAIQMYRNGETKIPLCWAFDKNFVNKIDRKG